MLDDGLDHLGVCRRRKLASKISSLSTRRKLAKLVNSSSHQRMSKTDIQTWAQESRLLADDNAETGEAFQWDAIETNWDDGFIPYAQKMLLTGSTKRRSEFLKERMVPLASRAGAISILLPITSYSRTHVHFAISLNPQCIRRKH